MGAVAEEALATDTAVGSVAYTSCGTPRIERTRRSRSSMGRPSRARGPVHVCMHRPSPSSTAMVCAMPHGWSSCGTTAMCQHEAAPRASRRDARWRRRRTAARFFDGRGMVNSFERGVPSAGRTRSGLDTTRSNSDRRSRVWLQVTALVRWGHATSAPRLVRDSRSGIIRRCTSPHFRSPRARRACRGVCWRRRRPALRSGHESLP